MKLEIITPEKLAFCGKVQSVTLPGTMGLFEVLENHAPLVSSLAAGKIVIVKENNEIREMHTEGGFVEISNNEINVCVETLTS